MGLKAYLSQALAERWLWWYDCRSNICHIVWNTSISF